TEQIRRANRLFASDSLFLRQYLLIPVEKSSPYYPKEDRPQSFPSMNFSLNDTPTSSSPASGSSELSLQNEEVVQEHNNRNTSCSTESMDTADNPTLSPEEESRKSINDFLDKIDNTIAASKQYVAKSQSSE
uniref:LysM domain-containing protein n=1 Tax=Megaselia scalaris TaxID=36166 RepID=T1GLF9_MEGSC